MIFFKVESGKPRTPLAFARLIWSPILTNHDPNPPITPLDGAGLNDTVVEAVSATDSQTATVAFAAAIAESVAATETQSSGNTFSDTVVETVTATESSTGTTPANFSDTVTESVAATDSCDATVLVPPVPPPVPVPLPGPLYGLSPVGVASATSEIRGVGTRSATSRLRGVGVSGNKDSIIPVKGPVS